VPIEFNIPDTTLLAVSAPRPVAGYTETILRVIGANTLMTGRNIGELVGREIPEIG
jgi:hypothetical protein